MPLAPLFVFLFGLLIGSFLNVVILRMNTGRSVVTGRSACARCSTRLSWYELVPVFSFIGLRGRCRTCKSRISYQYPLVELATAISFTALYTLEIVNPARYTFGGVLAFVFSCAVACTLIVIAIYDYHHKIIPDKVVYLFLLLALSGIVWRATRIADFSAITAIFGGFAVAAPFLILWAASRGRAMGFGDVKLALGIGWLVGFSAGLASVMVAFWIGGIFGIFLLAIGPRYSLKSEIPFAPFLILGLVIAVAFGLTLHTFFPLWS